MPVIRPFARPLLALMLVIPVTACLWDTDEAAVGRQGWSGGQRTAWYWGTQGSRLMPQTWFEALEQPGGAAPFADMAYLASFGFLDPAEGRAGARPIGFATDRQDDHAFKVTGLRWYEGQAGDKSHAEPWIGLNCAACHTARMTYGGVTTTVDGAPNLLDFQSFIEALDASLAATRTDPARWDRFAAKVLAGKDNAANRASLEMAFGQFADWQAKTEKMNKTDMRYGFGRLDAVGHIFNKVLMFAGADARLGHASDAPVSYPFLWGISDQEHVQWNGIARNSRFELPGRALEYGALGRNTGEVLGVFGEVLLVPGNPLKGYASSVRVESLDSMEQLVKVLEAPRWPAHFPPIDTALAAKGETLFDSDCVACHTKPQARPAAAPTERMISFEATLARNPADLTDIWMACNAFVHDGPTGPLEGSKDLDGKPFGPTASVARMLGASARGAILGKKADLVTVVFRTFFGVPSLPPVERAFDPNDPRADDRATCKQTPDTPVLGYKARPLDGIWATAPYLHNGSVASLYELLLPPDKRMAAFWVGSRAFDPVKVGYATTDPGGGQGFLLNTRTADGRPLDGNSNAGHDYGAARLTEADRMALIEYLKTE